MSKKTKPAIEPKPKAKPQQPQDAPAPADETQEQLSDENGAPADDTHGELKGEAAETATDTQAELNGETASDTGSNAEVKSDEAENDLEQGIEHLKKVADALQTGHQMIKRAKEVFEMYPDLQECHFTADGTAFTQPQHAVMHAQNLEVHETIIIKRSEV